MAAGETTATRLTEFSGVPAYNPYEGILSLSAVSVPLLPKPRYTILSERYNLVQGSWAYSSLMPMVPGLKIGLSPLLQWLIVPVVAWWLAKPGSHSL